MKRHLSSLLGGLRERIVLTPEEKRVLCFVLAAFFLGVTVKHYRETHPEPSVATKAPNRITASPSPMKKAQRKKTNDAIAPANVKD